MAVFLPNTILVWTITDTQALEKVRMRIKLSIATYLTKYGVNIYVNEYKLDIEDSGLNRDAVHLKHLDNDIF